MKKNIAVIGTAGIPSKYGGFETLTHNLVGELKDKHNFRVYCSSHNYPKNNRVSSFNGAELVYLPFKANGAQSIVYDIVSIFHSLFFADTLLILGVPGCAILPFIRFFTRKHIIVNIDGLEWKREKWNKLAKAVLRFSEFMAVKFAHVTIADNKGIQEHVEAEYGKVAKLIEYGADHAKKTKLSKDVLAKYPFLSHSYAFKVCRIEPENKVHLILKAFSELRSKHLVIIGNWDVSAYGKELKKTYANFTNIHLLDPIYEQKILDSIRGNCYVYIHGHSAGGTNPSLVEAMNLALPVIAYGVNYNRYTTENCALYFDDEQELKKLMINTRFEQYAEISEKMQRIAQYRYTWARVANMYNRCFAMSAVSASNETVSKGSMRTNYYSSRPKPGLA